MSKQGTKLTDLLDSERKKESTVSIRGRSVETPEGKNGFESGALVLTLNEKQWTDLMPLMNQVCVISK
jgi:hypothetical protein